MAKAALVLFMSALLWSSFREQGYGFLTVKPVPSAWSKMVSPGMYCDSDKLSVRIDRRSAMGWPRKEEVNIDGLDLNERHLVAILCDGKPLQSFKFRFSEFRNNKLCLTYDVYQGPQLFDRTQHGWGCK